MEVLKHLMGDSAQTILWWQMVLRAILIFVYTLMMLRLFGRRIFGENSALDIVVAIILGSTLSRALTANARLGPTLAACTALILIHYALGRLAAHSPSAGKLLKGTAIELASNGRIDLSAARRSGVSESDLLEALRVHAGAASLDNLDAAFLERNGDISVIAKDPRIPSRRVS